MMEGQAAESKALAVKHLRKEIYDSIWYAAHYHVRTEMRPG